MKEKNMDFEIRPAKAEEMDEFYRVAGTALVMPQSQQLTGVDPEWTLCAFEDGKLATSFAAWPLTMRFNGNGIPVAGITMVGTLPIFRRRGYLRKIMTQYFELLHDRGERSIAMLYASRAAIYQRYGFGIVSSRNSYRVEPRFLQFSYHVNIPGKFRELGDSDEDFGCLVDLYRRFRSNRTGYVHRGRVMWNARVLAKPPSDGVLGKVIYEEDGAPLGYAIYVITQTDKQPGPNQLLTVRDITWLSASAYQAIWRYFGNMDLVGEIIWDRAPLDDPLPQMLLEPRMLHSTSADGLLGRIIDIQQAFLKRPYTEKSTLLFDVTDELCPWNNGRWQLETSAEGSSVHPTDKKPQLKMPDSTLAMLIFGQISATEASRMERLEVLDSKALPIWDKTMRTLYRPFCADIF
jgi:predicted acetyltransferase